jgi:hypothetical protein
MCFGVHIPDFPDLVEGKNLGLKHVKTQNLGINRCQKPSWNHGCPMDFPNSLLRQAPTSSSSSADVVSAGVTWGRVSFCGSVGKWPEVPNWWDKSGCVNTYITLFGGMDINLPLMLGLG